MRVVNLPGLVHTRLTDGSAAAAVRTKQTATDIVAAREWLRAVFGTKLELYAEVEKTVLGLPQFKTWCPGDVAKHLPKEAIREAFALAPKYGLAAEVPLVVSSYIASLMGPEAGGGAE